MTTQDQPSDKGFLDMCIGVITDPVPTMQSVTRRRPIGWAFLIIVVISAVQGLAQAVSLNSAEFEDAEWLLGVVQGFSIVGGPVFAIAGAAFFAGIYWIMSRILGGRGSYASLFCGTAFAYVPAVFAIPFTLLTTQFETLGQGLSGLVGLCVVIWTIVLSVFAVQASNGFSTGRAAAAVLIPLAIIAFLALLLVLLVVVIIIAALPGWS